MEKNRMNREPAVCRRDGSAICLRNSRLEVRLYPALGGKIREIRELSHGFQPVFQSRTPLRPAECYAPFGDYDTSGIDDAFPTVVEEGLSWQGGELRLPDHGEIWSAAMDSRIDGGAVTLSMDSRLLPYRFQKEVSLEDNAVCLHYSIVNTGSEAFPCHWTFHGLLRYEKNLRLELPDQNQRVLNVTDSPSWGPVGEEYPLVGAKLPDGSLWDFHEMPQPVCAEKFWLTRPVTEGRCAVVYPDEGRRVVLEYDALQLPYLGCWITAGGYKGEYNLALEPSNGWYDSVGNALKQHRCPVLLPGEPWDFTLRIRIEAL